MGVTAENLDIEGTWRLLAVEEWIDGKLSNPYLQGQNPTGFIHYLPGQRMAVLIANGGRKHLSGDRYSAPIDERAESSATFTGYGGPYTREGNKLIHQLEISSYENDVGADYVRYIEIDGEDMWLVSAPMEHGGHQRVIRLKWRRVV